jgi:hypothetical protein
MATTMKLGSYEWMAQADTGKFASWLRVGSTSDPLNTTAGDLTTGRALVGDDIALPSGTVLQVNKNSFVPSGTQFVSYLTGTAAPNNSGSVTVGQQLTMSAAPTVDSPTSDVYGLSLQAQHTSGDFALRNLYGLQSNVVKNIASGTAALTNMVSYRAVNRPIAGAITNMYGIEIVQGATGDVGNVGTLMGVFIRNGVFGSATTQIGLNIEALTGATTNIGIQNASNLRQLGYARFGSLAVPTNTTDGDVTVQRLKVANGTIGSNIQFSVTGNGALSGFLRVGSEAAPTNTTAGDVTMARLNVGNVAFGTGVEAAIGGDATVSGFLRVGSGTAPSNTTAGDLTAVRLRMPDGAFQTAGTVFELTPADTAGATDTNVMRVLAAKDSSAGANSDVRGLEFTMQDKSASGTQRTLAGIKVLVWHMGAGTLTNSRAFEAKLQNDAGTTTNLDAFAVTTGTLAGTVTQARGLVIPNLGAAAVGSAIGIDIAAQSGASGQMAGIRNADCYAGTKYISLHGSTITPATTTDGYFVGKGFVIGKDQSPLSGTSFLAQPPDATLASFSVIGSQFSYTKDTGAGQINTLTTLVATASDTSASGTQSGQITAMRGNVNHSGAGTLSTAVAGEFGITQSAGAITTAVGINITPATLVGGTIGTYSGIQIGNLGAAAVGSAIGIDIAAQSSATTLNVGIRNADGRYLNSNVAKPVNPPAGQSYLYSRLNADLAGATNFKTFWALDENGFESAMSLRARTIYPMPLTLPTATANTALPANNTSAFVSHAEIAFPIKVNKILYNVSGAGNAANVIRIAIYSENGTQKYIDVTDAVGAATGVRTIDITDTTLAPGNYLFLICHSTFSTTACSVTTYTCDTTATAHIASEPDLGGTLTISGGAAPATIDPTALTTVAPSNKLPVIRLLGTALGS